MERRFIKSPSSLDELIESLHVLFESDKVNVEEVQEVMENYKSNEDHWGKFADYDHNVHLVSSNGNGLGRL
ncbi:Cysteine dioxygenase type 1 [Holothuria leucospilota]|uniref:Cysteine dioxygenase n=1 Tax=Holothuria leucospilota TaxID=206669 RepID=A0A9Q0YA82_HOLLE|nr:Cysteine dioxygenase type 1 [Holothuria leucospilota]